MTRNDHNNTQRAAVLASRNGGRRRNLMLAMTFGVLLAATGFVASQSFADNVNGTKVGMGGMSGMGGMGGFFSGGGDPAAAAARLERMAKHLAVEADATPAQQEKLAAIAKSAAGDLLPLRTKMREHRERTMALLASPTVDRGQIETQRAAQMQDADALSRRIAQALADASQVLTPEQRQKLAAHFAERRSEHRGHSKRHDGDHGKSSHGSPKSATEGERGPRS